MFCENCGKQLPEDAKFCVNCGAKADAAGTANTAQEETAAAVDIAEAEAVSSDEEAGPDTAQASDQQTAPSGVSQTGPVQPEAKPGPGKQPAEAATSQPLSEPVKPQPLSRPEVQKPYAAQKYAPKESIIVERIEPLSFWKFFGILLLQSIPVVNIIMLLVWSFSNSFNRNTKNYARAAFILGLIQFIALGVIIILNIGFIVEVLDAFGYTIDFGW